MINNIYKDCILIYIMKLIYFILFYIVNTTKIITNNNYPSCRNCIYHKPAKYGEFTSSLSQCNKFGTKNIITDVIRYEYADSARFDDKLCGINGKYFELDKNIEFKIILYYIFSPNVAFFYPCILLLIAINIKRNSKYFFITNILIIILKKKILNIFFFL